MDIVKKTSRFFVTLVATIMLISGGLTMSFAADVFPPSVDIELKVDNSIDVEKTVTTDEIPQNLDFALLVDLSYSYNDDLDNIKSVSEGLYDDITAVSPTSIFGLASFIDYNQLPWGNASDYEFKLELDLDNNKTSWLDAINALTVGNGMDWDESQYKGLMSTAESMSWRDNSRRVIAITTDATFHVPTDTGGTYPGPSRNDTVQTLNKLGISVIAIKAPTAGPEMDDIANATGGTVVNTSATSAEIADAVLEGLSNLPVTVIPDASDCTVLDVSFDSASESVISGETATFVETIGVPNDDSLMGTTVACEVVFNDENDNLLGTQDISVYVPDTIAPEVSCEATTNPSGKNVPKAGEKSKGQNEDGFYALFAQDNVDKDLEIYVNGLGPFTSEDKVKITEAPGAEASVKEMGGNVDYHLILDSDAIVTVVDAAGNAASTTCLVAPLPK